MILSLQITPFSEVNDHKGLLSKVSMIAMLVENHATGPMEVKLELTAAVRTLSAL